VTALDELTHAKTILLTSYRRDGSPVATPVSLAFDGERAFFRTWNTAWKARRLARNPNVEIAPSTLRGKQTGPAIRAHARLLDGDEAKQARRALARRHPFLHGLLVPLGHRLKRVRTVHYELTRPD
jgi:PPOX class probable F420-dependent enzyme